MDIEEIIKPETDTEKKIVKDESFREGCLYGVPRSGHPEGPVIFHIAEVLNNVDKYSSGNMRRDLRLVGIIHDAFKYKVDKTKPKTGDNHHARLARKFAEKYISDKKILGVIEFHDEAYDSWFEGGKRGNWDLANERAKKLIRKIRGYLDLYLTFYKCDNRTGDKSPENYEWFLSQVEKQKKLEF